MKRISLSLMILALMAGSAFAQAPVVETGWSVFVIREGATEAPFILDNDDYEADAIEIGTTESGQKVGLATDLINGATISQISTLHIDRLDDVASSGSLYGPYFNIWVTDGAGNYAVLSNEPSDGEWAGSRWDVPDWDFLKTKRCKVYETPGATGGQPGTSWVATHTGQSSNITFEDVGDLIISPPPPAYIQNPANAVGSGAPDELGTDIAYGYTWVFGDTAANYVTGGDGFIVHNYYATANFPVMNITQGLNYTTIQPAINGAAPGDVIQVAAGVYEETLNITTAGLQIIGEDQATVIVDPTGLATNNAGIYVAADDVTLQSLTLRSTVTNSLPRYGIKIGEVDGCHLEDVTARDVYRSGIDVLGASNLTVLNVSSLDNGGHGLALVDCNDVTVTSLTALGNAWQNVSVATWGRYTPLGTSGIVFDGMNSFGDLFQIEMGDYNNPGVSPAGDAVITYSTNIADGADLTVQAGDFGFAVHGTQDDGPDQERIWFFSTLANASLLPPLAPIGHWTGADMFIESLTDDMLYVVENCSIQAAIDAADPGDEISVAAGHYEEQLYIGKDNLTLTGAGAGSTFVEAPATMPLFFTTSADNYPVIFLDGAAGTTITGLTIDGLGRGANNYRFTGLGLYNADGTFSEMAVTGLRNEPLNGSQHGIGLYVIADDAVARNVSFTNVDVTDCQKNATTFHGEGLTISADNLDCTGNGPLGLGLPAQNGMQVSGGASAVLTGCDLADYDYTDPAWTATALLVYGPGTVTGTGGTITSCKTSVYYVDASGSLDGYTVTDPQSDALYAYSSGAKAPMREVPQPVDSPESAAAGGKAALTFGLYNSTFTGNDIADMAGPIAWASGPVEFNMQGCTIQNFDYGLYLYEDGGTITGSASGNVIAGNGTYGAYSNTAVPYPALGNDWGHFTGPYHPTLNPAGTGNEVSDNILFEPWIGMATAEVAPAASGPINCSESQVLTFSYTPDAGTPDMFLYNAVVRATAEVAFGTITDLLPFGTVSNNFYALDNGDGSWTITGATVGSPSSPVTGPADLFSIQFLPVSDGTADITFDSLVLRDPDNNTIPVALSGATIEVDCTEPAGVTDIVADPGHNKVDVSWTHDGTDVVAYEVYRGLWYDTTAGVSAYPEYDDLPGNVIPTRPVDRADAVSSAEWVLAGTVAVGTNSLVDLWADHLSRGVYYYEVFPVDAAANYGPVAPANDRATNYWLGDLDQAPGSADPDGEVDAFDINVLGTAFGTTAGGGMYNAETDVGPTDDWSRLGIPTTDDVINFEDLMVFAMNFGVVSSSKTMEPYGSSVDLAWVSYDDGTMALRLVDGSGLKGLRITADVAVRNVSAGALLDEQSELTFVKNVGNRLDASVAVMGLNTGFSGSGDLLVIAADQEIARGQLTITARAVDNKELAVNLDESSDVAIPRVFELHRNYPNPFNPLTKISFSLPAAHNVELSVYSLDGRKVATLVNELREPGLHEVLWTGRDDNGRTVASGTYFYRLNAGPYSDVKKMTLMK
jgi:hypothetical protein